MGFWPCRGPVPRPGAQPTASVPGTVSWSHSVQSRGSQRIGIQRIPGTYHHPLPVVLQIRDGAVRFGRVGPEVPQDPALRGGVGNQVALVVSREDEISGRTEQTRAEGGRSAVEIGVLMLPAYFAGVDIERLQNPSGRT